MLILPWIYQSVNLVQLRSHISVKKSVVVKFVLWIQRSRLSLIFQSLRPGESFGDFLVWPVIITVFVRIFPLLPVLLLCKAVSFKWTPECLHLNLWQLYSVVPPVLVAPHFGKPFRLEVDASGTGVGAVLLQTGEDGLNHSISFFLKKFLKH